MHHHYLPEFYLKFWADGPDYKVPYFSRHAGRVVQSRIAPRSTGYEPGLYALENVSDAQRDDIELKFFSPLDGDAAPIHKRLEQRDEFTFTFEERATWAKFLLAANARVPDKIQGAKKRGSAALLESLEDQPEQFLNAKGDTPEATMTEWVRNHRRGLIENIGLAQLMNWLSDERNLRPVMKLDWTVHDVSAGGIELLTCDRPFWNWGDPAHPQFTITLPLSPRSLFVASRLPSVADRMAEAGPGGLGTQANITIVANARLRVYGRADIEFVNAHLKHPAPQT